MDSASTSVSCPFCSWPAVAPDMATCPRCKSPLRDPASEHVPVNSTRLEKVDPRVARAAKQIAAAKAPSTPPAADSAARQRPIQRPPLAAICLVDDGQETGEWFRIRTASVVIGRVEGDIRIPHDDAISSAHLEISRHLADGRYRWQLRDLGSRNGTFVRTASALLRNGQELQLGSQRFRFEIAPTADSPPHDDSHNQTRAWRPADAHTNVTQPRLVSLTSSDDLPPIPIGPDTWIGHDSAACQVVVTDPFISSKHARLFQSSAGRWTIEDNSSLNGTWVRVKEIHIEQGAEFMAGEQRFLFRVQ